jgi:hypothetical protein
MESTANEMMNRKMTGIHFVLIVPLIQMKSSKVIHILGYSIRHFMHELFQHTVESYHWDGFAGQ